MKSIDRIYLALCSYFSRIGHIILCGVERLRADSSDRITNTSWIKWKKRKKRRKKPNGACKGADEIKPSQNAIFTPSPRLFHTLRAYWRFRCHRKRAQPNTFPFKTHFSPSISLINLGAMLFYSIDFTTPSLCFFFVLLPFLPLRIHRCWSDLWKFILSVGIDSKWKRWRNGKKKNNEALLKADMSVQVADCFRYCFWHGEYKWAIYSTSSQPIIVCGEWPTLTLSQTLVLSFTILHIWCEFRHIACTNMTFNASFFHALSCWCHKPIVNEVLIDFFFLLIRHPLIPRYISRALRTSLTLSIEISWIFSKYRFYTEQPSIHSLDMLFSYDENWFTLN